MQQNNKSPLTVLGPFLKAEKSRLILSVILEILSVLAGLIPYYFIARVITLILNNKLTLKHIFLYSGLFFIGFLLKILFHSESTKRSHKSAFAILSQIRIAMADKLGKLPMGYILARPSGSFKEVIFDLVEKLEKPFAHLIPEMTGNLVGPIVVIIYLLIIDWRIALISLITLPLGYLAFMFMMKDYESRFKNYIQSGKDMTSSVVEYVSGIDVIKAFNQSASSYKKYSKVMNGHRDSMLVWFKDTMFFSILGQAIMVSTLLFVLPAGAYFYWQQSLSLDRYVFATILSLGIVPPLMKAFEFIDTLAEINTYVAEIDDILSADELVRPSQPVALNDYQITFDNVSFAYHQTDVINQISLTIEPNQMTALVGPSGSGKSTLARLIASFWDYTDGNITFGGVSLKQIPLNQLMNMITYVTQDNFLFNQTIRENILAGRPEASQAEVIEAAKKASIHDFITQLPDGYDTMVGDRGAKLSGGEKQRIAIARAILKDAPIIILDEATAYTDPENEEKIQASINAMIRHKTVIVIAHRLSTIVGADKIIVIESGQKVAEGTHQQLLETSDLYRSMWLAHIGVKDGLAKEVSHV